VQIYETQFSLKEFNEGFRRKVVSISKQELCKVQGLFRGWKSELPYRYVEPGNERIKNCQHSYIFIAFISATCFKHKGSYSG
jgi:hypothetical protein